MDESQHSSYDHQIWLSREGWKKACVRACSSALGSGPHFGWVWFSGQVYEQLETGASICRLAWVSSRHSEY